MAWVLPGGRWITVSLRPEGSYDSVLRVYDLELANKGELGIYAEISVGLRPNISTIKPVDLLARNDLGYGSVSFLCYAETTNGG